MRELGPAPCLLGNWRRMPHPTTQHRCLKQEHPASVSSALIDVIDLVPRQDDQKDNRTNTREMDLLGLPPYALIGGPQRAVWDAEFISY